MEGKLQVDGTLARSHRKCLRRQWVFANNDTYFHSVGGIEGHVRREGEGGRTFWGASPSEEYVSLVEEVDEVDELD
jgi:hypothetical protein